MVGSIVSGHSSLDLLDFDDFGDGAFEFFEDPFPPFPFPFDDGCLVLLPFPPFPLEEGALLLDEPFPLPPLPFDGLEEPFPDPLPLFDIDFEDGVGPAVVVTAVVAANGFCGGRPFSRSSSTCTTGSEKEAATRRFISAWLGICRDDGANTPLISYSIVKVGVTVEPISSLTNSVNTLTPLSSKNRMKNSSRYCCVTPAASPMSCSVGVVLPSMVYVTLNGVAWTTTVATGGLDPPAGPLTGRSDG
jgi:hypothetical protein